MKATIYEFSAWVNIVNKREMLSKIEKVLDFSNFQVVGYIQHSFLLDEVNAITAVWLLAESHLAVHSFPEEKKTYFQLSSCVENQHNRFLDAFYSEFSDSILSSKK